MYICPFYVPHHPKNQIKNKTRKWKPPGVHPPTQADTYNGPKTLNSFFLIVLNRTPVVFGRHPDANSGATYFLWNSHNLSEF